MKPLLTKNILPKFTSIGLLLFLIFFFVITPFFSESPYANFVLDLSVISLLILSVYMCSENRRYIILSSLLAAPAFIRLIYPTAEVNAITLSLNAGFFSFVIYVLLNKLFQTKNITMDVIYAAISIYLLIGVLWGILYMLLEFFFVGSFQFPQGMVLKPMYAEFDQDMLYYSFVTLTTLGYGDILPLTPPAKNLSALEAMVGPIYLTVLVARLVGMHISQEKP